MVITPGANNRSVAEHAVAMIFALSKNLIEAQNEMCKGNWEIRGAKKAFELEGKTVGIPWAWSNRKRNSQNLQRLRNENCSV